MNIYRVTSTWTNLDGSLGEQTWDLNTAWAAKYFTYNIAGEWPEIGQTYPAITRNNGGITVDIRIDVLSEGI